MDDLFLRVLNCHRWQSSCSLRYLRQFFRGRTKCWLFFVVHSVYTTVTKATITTDQIKTVLDTHNHLRRGEGATDMMKLVTKYMFAWYLDINHVSSNDDYILSTTIIRYYIMRGQAAARDNNNTYVYVMFYKIYIYYYIRKPFIAT